MSGRVWVDGINGEISKGSDSKIFFIQNSEKIVVAAVIDMGPNELQVFVQPHARGNGHLVKALKSAILPYLFNTDRDKQRIIFSTDQGRHHAELAGFHILSDESAEISYEDFPSIPDLQAGTVPPSEMQKERITGRLEMAANMIRIARDDIQTAFGDLGLCEG